MVHQSLGVGAISYVESHHPYSERVLIDKVVSIFTLLLPAISEEDLFKGIAKVVKKAVTLKNNMMEEQALYDCYWIKGGQNFDPDKMDLAGHEGDGRIALCTFPGLARILLEQGKKVTVHVVKASIVLESTII